jgi:hypothetical protein
MEVDGVVECSSGVNSWLWVPFSRPRGVEKEGQQLQEGQSMVPSAATVAAQ